MGKTLSYFDFAENDYLYLKETVNQGMVANAICSISQSVCERYLKHVIDINTFSFDVSKEMATHSIRVLAKFLKKNVLDFKCDWDVAIKVNGYYFEVRYPGDDSFIVDSDDVKTCWSSVEEIRNSVIKYCTTNSSNPSLNVESEAIDFVKRLKDNADRLS